MADKDQGRNPAIDPGDEAGGDELLALKKRARRRLVGAVALALLAVIVLPMVMDQEPKPLTQDIQIRIPSEDPGPASPLSRLVPGKPVPTPLPADTKTPAPAPAVTAAAPAAPTEAATQAKAEPPKQAATNEPAHVASAEKPVDKPAAKSPPAPKKSESTHPDAPPKGEQWVVQLGAYKELANVKALQAKLKENGYPSYTEKVETPQGERLRVRGGPFASQAAAEKAQARLKKLSVGAPAGGVVAQK
ncbi:MAG: SPOR domain-containing protein [Betaproteobacteria bacterium]|nr:SPOR domain-containing protein [Betaproteobacteria bacterium]